MTATQTPTQTALDRQMLLVPVAGAEAPRTSVPDAELAAQLQEKFEREGRLGPPPEPEKRRRSLLPIVRGVLVVLAALSLGLVVQLTLVSSLEHHSAQVGLYNQFRRELALGTAPIGPCGQTACTRGHKPLPPGTPIALIKIPSIGVQQVVIEGTSGSILAEGPGHYRSTVFPGGGGTSVILGRAAAYGGPFGRIADLKKGDKITVITQVGSSVFRVVDTRTGGIEHRRIPVTEARLALGTASGPAFAPSGVVWVDADKVGQPLASFRPAGHTVPASERPLGFDTSALWVLGLLALALAAVFAAAVWTWRRRGHAQAWIVFTAPLLLLWMFAVDQIARLLPNLL